MRRGRPLLSRAARGSLMPSLFFKSCRAEYRYVSVLNHRLFSPLLRERRGPGRVSIYRQSKKRRGFRDVAMAAGQRVAPRQARTALPFSRRVRSLSEVVISQSLGAEWRRKWLPIAWLATWGLAVMSCGCSLLVGHRVARNCILGTHLADERHGQGSGPVAGACEQQGYSMGDVCGDHPLRAVLGLCEEMESACLWRGAAQEKCCGRYSSLQ